MLKNKTRIIKFSFGFFFALFLLAGQMVEVEKTYAIGEKTGQCYCETKKDGAITDYGCYGDVGHSPSLAVAAKCDSFTVTDVDIKCSYKTTKDLCNLEVDKTKAAMPATAGSGTGAGGSSVASKLIPQCALDNEWKPNSECGDVSIFVVLMFQITNYLFTIIGALALLMFIYGGVMMIISSGNPESIKKGTDAMMAAVIGLVVAFGGYALISFLGGAIGLKDIYRLQ